MSSLSCWLKFSWLPHAFHCVQCCARAVHHLTPGTVIDSILCVKGCNFLQTLLRHLHGTAYKVRLAGWLRCGQNPGAEHSWHLQDMLSAIANDSKVLSTCHGQPAILERRKLDRITVETDAKAHAALELPHAQETLDANYTSRGETAKGSVLLAVTSSLRQKLQALGQDSRGEGTSAGALQCQIKPQAFARRWPKKRRRERSWKGGCEELALQPTLKPRRVSRLVNTYDIAGRSVPKYKWTILLRPLHG